MSVHSVMQELLTRQEALLFLLGRHAFPVPQRQSRLPGALYTQSFSLTGPLPSHPPAITLRHGGVYDPL